MKTEYELDENGIVPVALSEMMIEEYEYSPSNNQEAALYENLCMLQKSHEHLRDENIKLNEIVQDGIRNIETSVEYDKAWGIQDMECDEPEYQRWAGFVVWLKKARGVYKA